MVKFGAKHVQWAMLRYGITREQLAAACGLNVATIKRALNTDMATEKTICLVASAIYRRRRAVERSVRRGNEGNSL